MTRVDILKKAFPQAEVNQKFGYIDLEIRYTRGDEKCKLYISITESESLDANIDEINNKLQSVDIIPLKDWNRMTVKSSSFTGRQVDNLAIEYKGTYYLINCEDEGLSFNIVQKINKL